MEDLSAQNGADNSSWNTNGDRLLSCCSSNIMINGGSPSQGRVEIFNWKDSESLIVMR